MDDVELDDRLLDAAPFASQNDGRRAGLIESVVSECVPVKRRASRAALSVGIAVAILAGGATAAAALAPLYFGQEEPDLTFQRVTDTGATCTIEFYLSPTGELPDDDPAVVAAREILADLDLTNLRIDGDLLEQGRQDNAEQADWREARGDSREMTSDPDAAAIAGTVFAIVDERLRELDLNPDNVMAQVPSDCTNSGADR